MEYFIWLFWIPVLGLQGSFEDTMVCLVCQTQEIKKAASDF